MTDNITALIAAAHRRVGGIARDSMTERLIASLADALAEQSQQREAAEAEVERLHSWDGLMGLLDEHWPAEIFPTLPDSDQRDSGPRIVSLLRWVDAAEAALATARADALEEAAQEYSQHGYVSGIHTDGFFVIRDKETYVDDWLRARAAATTGGEGHE